MAPFRGRSLPVRLAGVGDPSNRDDLARGHERNRVRERDDLHHPHLDGRERSGPGAAQEAENDIADLQRQLQDAKSKSQLETGQLEKKRRTALDATKVQFEELEQQEVEAREQLENHSAELKQRELEIQARESEEASRLQGMETDIISQRDQGIAKVEQAIDQLSTQTQATLQQLRISKLEVQAPQNQELGNNAIKSISGA